MNCVICGMSMKFFFSKNFNLHELEMVDYWRCQDCGFVISKTHVDMPDAKWKELNFNYHNAFLGGDFNDDDPRWISRLRLQAEIINDLVELGILHKNRWLDYSSGDGKLSSILKSSYKLHLMNYDKYTPVGDDFLLEKDLSSKKFDFVITTSVFEHIAKREDYDFIASLVSEDGVMGLHTLVCENIPKDPSWFYLLPVHCAFHTNKSMSLLLQQWGYKASIYNVEARLWLLFKSNSDAVKAAVDKANQRSPSSPMYLFDNGFVDYWK